MRFKEGDKVEFIDQGELKQGVVTEIKASPFGISYLMTFDENNKTIWAAEYLLLSPAQVLKVPQFVADWYEQHRHKLEYSIWGYIYDWDDQDCESDFYDFMKIEEMRERIHPHDNTTNPEEIWNSLDWIKVILVYSGQLEKVDDVYKERWVAE
ncbi:DUF1642 domain-containing protein [Listeria monocytogenes]|nr:DUF1642 domain-containing protein [Listeria monocytogenes]